MPWRFAGMRYAQCGIRSRCWTRRCAFRWFRSSHDVRRERLVMARVSDENYGYYLLSYQSEHPAGEIGYERIAVRPRDPRIELRARTGYRYGL